MTIETAELIDLSTRLRNRALQTQRSERFVHILGVEGMAVALAAKWGASTEKALIAALLHDAAKTEPLETQQALMEQTGPFAAREEDQQHPAIWHALAAVTVARRDYGIEDPEILEAVAWHPTGNEGIGPVALALYVADFLEPSRNFPGIDALRREIFPLQPREAAQAVARHKLQRLLEKQKKPHGRTLRMCEWLGRAA